MPHIHTEPGQIDFTADVFVVYKNKVLFRFHDKHKIWLVPGGHIELDETPQVAAVREVKEEVGLDVEIYLPYILPVFPENESSHLASPEYQELIPPQAMNIHRISEDHKHISLVYFAASKTDEIIEPDGEEKSGGCIWLTKNEIVAHPELHESMKNYGLKALELLGDWK